MSKIFYDSNKMEKQILSTVRESKIQLNKAIEEATNITFPSDVGWTNICTKLDNLSKMYQKFLMWGETLNQKYTSSAEKNLSDIRKIDDKGIKERNRIVKFM